MQVSFDERVKGVLFGTAFGDALGAPVERLSQQQIVDLYGGPVTTVNNKWYKADAEPVARMGRTRGYGIVTDDTLMTLSLVNVYCNLGRHIDAFDMATEFIKEIAFRPRYLAELGRVANIIERLHYPERHLYNRLALANCDPREGGQGNMVNCGAAMYISPVGIINACNPKAAYDEAIDFACGHQLSYGLEAAGVFAACIAAAFQPGATESSIVETAITLAKDGTKEAIRDICKAARKLKGKKEDKKLVADAFFEIILKYSPVAGHDVLTIDRVGQPTQNYTPSRTYSIEELPMALGYLILNEGDPIQAVVDGVNSGRDADSIGVMAAAICGALYGSSIFDPKEIRTIEDINRLDLEDSVSRFTKTVRAIIHSDLDKAHNLEAQLKETL